MHTNVITIIKMVIVNGHCKAFVWQIQFFLFFLSE